MNKNEYLDYVRVLYDRVSSEGRLAGITAWGLLIAIVYLIWNIIPMYSGIRNNNELIETSLLLYGYLQISLYFLYMFFSFSFNNVNSSGFNNRFYRNTDAGVLVFLFILILTIGNLY